MSLLDLLFFGILLWLVLRAAGRAAGRGSQTGERPPEDVLRRPGPPQRPRQPPRPGPGRRPEGRPRLELEVEPAVGEGEVRRAVLDELRRWEEEQRRREAELERRRSAEPERPPPTPRHPVPPAPVAATPPGGEPPAAGVARPRRRAGGLPELGGYSPLQRAVLFSEILGLPRALRDGAGAGGPLSRGS